jgi:hypothetical protein
MTLAELQRYFAAVATSTSGPPSDIDDVFQSSARLSARARLAIYNRGYHYRLLDSLASVFTHTKRALGDAEFERLGLSYLAQHPSEHPAVERVGRLFPTYLSTLTTLPSELADLAVLEWARLCALVAPNPSELASAHGVDPLRFPQSRLRFVASLSLHSLDERALTLFSKTATPPERRAAQNEGAPRAQPCGVAVWRKQYRVQHQALDALELAALRLALSGAPVSQFCELFDTGSDARDAERAFRMVSSWFAREWIEAGDAPSP